LDAYYNLSTDHGLDQKFNSAVRAPGPPGQRHRARSSVLDDVVSGRVTTVAELCTRERCSVRQVNMTISLAFLAPNLVKEKAEKPSFA